MRSPFHRTARRSAFLTTVALLGSGLSLLCAVPRATAQKVNERNATHVVLITLDGFAADNLDDPKLPLPNLRRLVAEGARADRMSVITPSVTWPDHTTLVTGVTPAKHGVLANGIIEPSTGATPRVVNPRRSKAEMCRFPTIYDLAHEAGLRTAEINWPVTRDAPTLDWSFPDYPDSLKHTTPALVTELQNQKLLTDPTEPAFRAMGSVMRDYVWTQAAAHLLRKYQPHVLLLHLLNTDGTQHTYGPHTPEAYAALALADRCVGDIVDAVRDSGAKDRTAIFVTADHGFANITQEVRPNVRLLRAGLIRKTGDGPNEKLEYDAQAIPEGGVMLVYVPDGRLHPELIEKTRTALAGIEGVERIYEPKDYAELGLPLPKLNPQSPDFVLAAKDGYGSSASVVGEETMPLARPAGTHGYVASNPKMDALFVAAGAHIKKGARLSRIRNVDVAPSLARLLGLTMRDVDGAPLSGILDFN